MAEKIPTLPPESPARMEVYQPLSRLALAGLAIAGGFAAVIGVFSLVALFTGVPLFLRIESLVIPALGAALAYAGRQQIRAAEGVLSGMALTTWALWLGGLSGLGYAAYYFGTYFAITWQASTFTKEWLDKIRADKVMEAFLDTQEPAKRKNDKPSDLDYMVQRYGRKELPHFQDGEILKILRDAATSGEIKSLGIKDWEYSSKGYKVEELYQATTLEATYEMLIVVRGSTGPEFEGRKWQVVWENVGYLGKPQLTELGQVLTQWRQQTRQFGSEWLMQRHQGDRLGSYLNTLPPNQRQAIMKKLPIQLPLVELTLGSMAEVGGPMARFLKIGSWGNSEIVGWFFVPGYRKFAAGGLVDAAELAAPKPVKDDIIQAVKQNFFHPNVVVIRPQDTTGSTRPVHQDQGQFQILQNVEVGFYPQGMVTPSTTPKYRCDAYLVLESDTGPMTLERKPVWRVASLKLVRGGPGTAEPKPPGRGMPQGPGR